MQLSRERTLEADNDTASDAYSKKTHKNLTFALNDLLTNLIHKEEEPEMN